ncbi:MAG TPA: low affinity iron permease family protein [Alphaproteobacteria bacterium]|nr:low affinity iron permease family protein [Alphaproteobacteria bacterium]
MTAKQRKVALHKRFFAHFARVVEAEVGRPHTFGIAFFIVVAWAVSGPLFGWSDTWQLVINTGTTIITFLMVFIIQYAQNRDTDAIKLKLDELILATKEADNKMIDLEELSEEELEDLRQSLLKVVRSRKTDD